MIPIILCAILAIGLMVYLIVGTERGSSAESRRGKIRVQLGVPVQVSTAEQQFVAEGKNISHGGMLLRSDLPVKVAQPVQLTFTLPEQTPVEIPAVVCHTRGQHFGVMFDPTHQRRIVIERFVRRATEEDHRRAAKAATKTGV